LSPAPTTPSDVLALRMYNFERETEATVVAWMLTLGLVTFFAFFYARKRYRDAQVIEFSHVLTTNKAQLLMLRQQLQHLRGAELSAAFRLVAKKHSTCEYTREEGGDMGSYQRRDKRELARDRGIQWEAEIMERAPVGVVRGPVRGPKFWGSAGGSTGDGGYHLVLVRRRDAWWGPPEVMDGSVAAPAGKGGVKND